MTFGLRYTRLIGLGAAVLICALGWSATAGDERVISMYNIHTKETLTIAYKRNGAIVPGAMEKLNHFMRDWRRDESHKMDPDLIDLLWSLHAELGSRQPMHLISGYRSPRTNESLRRSGGGQARFSQHMLGKAADIWFPDIPLKQLRYSAIIRERGGVGYYPNSGVPFVHVDTGSVRTWPKLPRLELALLFPNGRTKHLPQDGRALSREDSRIALAQLHAKGGELPLALRRRNRPETVLASFTPDSAPKPTVLAEAAPVLPAENAPPSSPEGKEKAVAMLTPSPARAPEGAPALGYVNAGPQFDASETLTTVASEYDDEDPDEFYYQPFPIGPLMTEASVASADFADHAQAPNMAGANVLFANPNGMLSFEFKRGMQFAELVWASRFSGQAISSDLLAAHAAKRTLALGVKARRPSDKPSAVAASEPARRKPAAPAPAAHPAPASPAPTAIASAKPPVETGKAKPAEKSAPPTSVTASAAGGEEGSSFWSIFSAPSSVSYGFGPGN